MKNILVVYTGGTICTFEEKNVRVLNVDAAKAVIVRNFQRSNVSDSSLNSVKFVDCELETKTLSENMTIKKWNDIISHIKEQDFTKYDGIIVAHGTDSLAYSAALFAMVFHDTSIPIMLVSGNRPPNDALTNANDNFRTAVELIADGVAPNVYVVYKNMDGKNYLHLGTSVVQCANFSEDFYSATKERALYLADDRNLRKAVLGRCVVYSDKRSDKKVEWHFSEDQGKVLCIQPYVGLDYEQISLEGVKAIVHGTYHSGTVCVERTYEDEEYFENSILHLADRCKEEEIPIFAAPCELAPGQYSTVYDAVKNGGIIPLSMTFEAAYAKVLLGVSAGFQGEALLEFIKEELNNEFVL